MNSKKTMAGVCWVCDRRWAMYVFRDADGYRRGLCRRCARDLFHSLREAVAAETDEREEVA